MIPLLAWFLAACTCNPPPTTTDLPSDAAPSDDAKEKKEAKKGKKGKGKKGKGKTPAEVTKVPVTIYLLDRAAYDAGTEPWLVPVEREVGDKAPEKNAVWILFKGPTEEEAAKGLELVASGAEGFEAFELVDGVATLQLRGGCESGGSTVTVWDHIHETLTGFDTVQRVVVKGPEGQTADPDGEGDSRPACLEP